MCRTWRRNDATDSKMGCLRRKRIVSESLRAAILAHGAALATLPDEPIYPRFGAGP